MRLAQTPFCLLLLCTTTFGVAAEINERTNFPKDVQAVISKSCLECHGSDAAEGGVRFDALASLDLTSRLDLLNKTQQQLFFGMMPPPEAQKPSAQEHMLLASWVRDELQKHGASEQDKKLAYPEYGNYVEHAKLFSGEIQDKAFTPARRWLVSPQIFQERVLDIFRLEGREREAMKISGFYGVTNPFVLPDKPGVRDYDNAVLDGGHLLVMLANVEWISHKQIRAARVKKGELKADQFENPKDRWYPKITPEPFEKIILKEAKPSDEELAAAIQEQFASVLRRPADKRELEKYLALSRAAIDVGGNTEGLRQMLVSVLLESEFLYRLEFGSCVADKQGRRKLAPREAAYAISYALGDRGPDATLLKAADEGKLLDKVDFRREVTRLLADENYYRGAVDPSLNGKHIRSHVIAHPKIVRFFREFFGYPGALKVFKDITRSDGYYENPDRGHTGSPGWLIQEADELVICCLDSNQQVFEKLLTTDEFFVYHNMDTKAGQELIASWRQVYESLKDTAWKTDPEHVMRDHVPLLTSAKILDPREKELWKQKRAFLSYMYYFQDTFGQGTIPFTRGPFTHGYSYNHSPSYSLPTLPTRFRYEGVENPKYKEPKDHPVYWNYPVEQPFRIANRKGILTHPAWLVAHSQNAATDPVRRGRWIREKLLAGSVPDVPITVDAQIPEDPHKTLRERLDSVTTKQECWKCHQQMNPLGLAFEQFDDFGRYRTAESLEYPENLLEKTKTKYGADTYKTKAVNPAGKLTGTGDKQLDGEVADALDLIERLGKSQRVRQSIIRYAFRFYLGRNELLSDSQTLIEADQAYVASGGSFKAVIVSLLTSDSFIYRK